MSQNDSQNLGNSFDTGGSDFSWQEVTWQKVEGSFKDRNIECVSFGVHACDNTLESCPRESFRKEGFFDNHPFKLSPWTDNDHMDTMRTGG